ncbi:MAG: DUF6252 family protein [Agriterribacter sp.]
MKYTPLLLLLLLFSIAISCKKDGLTKATQNGANTFSCLIDGRIFKPCSEPIIGGPSDPPVFVSLSVSNGIASAYIGASCNEPWPYQGFTIEIGSLKGPGEYLLSDGSNGITFSTYKGNSTRTYSSYNTGKGKITITKDDRVNTILSGTFEFEGMDYDEPDKIVKVTSGRFDINYKK